MGLFATVGRVLGAFCITQHIGLHVSGLVGSNSTTNYWLPFRVPTGLFSMVRS